MKKQQLLALGLALTIAGGTVAGTPLSAVAKDITNETATVQQESRTETSKQEESVTENLSEEKGEKSTEADTELADGDDVNEEKEADKSQTGENDSKPADEKTTDEKSTDVKNTDEKSADQKADPTIKGEVGHKAEGKTADTADKSGSAQAQAAETDIAELAAVDKSALEEIIGIAEAELQHEERFTPDSFRVFKAALDAAKQVRDDESATAAQVNQAAQNLLNAYQNLIFTVSGYSQYVQDLIDEAEKNMAGELLYTPESWNAYQLAKRAMYALKDNPNAYTQAQADAIIDQFIDAYNKLAMIPDVTDKTDLKEAISLAESIVQNPALYTPATVAAVQAVLDSMDTSEDAVNALNSYETDQLLNQLLNVLANAELSVDGLKAQADALKGFIDQLRATGAYNETALRNLEARIAAVEIVLNTAGVTDAQLKQAAVELNAVQSEIENLGMDAENMKGLLAALVNDPAYQTLYSDIQAGSKEYTENSRSFFVEAYEEAKALLQTSNTADAEVYYEAFMKLQLAKNTIVKTADAGSTMLSDLDTIIQQEKNIVGKPGGITQEYMDALQAVREELAEALSQAPIDNEVVESLVDKANSIILSANENRIPLPKEEKPESGNKIEKKPVSMQNTSTIKKTTVTASQNPKTGDPASMAGLLMLLGGSAGTILKIRKRKDQEE